ncbi:CD225/dispanin family protein [Panacibacter ginsenosidivorans]|uniref:CD225/dispanin family protein n=1 Tax=Panacibacter ginsenosidivorans TaxID=1813871 RepID=A0A5B8V8F1_9BACT|nr:CD225/dispanin family protein [Panacibacter ginsenosidivorans]QEC67111.1 CD225/dispanin family protein [Panacibacter ginsenosidivorans]
MENFSQQPYYQQQPVNPPKNWLVESILVTIFCCLPFGIAGIVFASQVNSKFAAGDYAGAEQASKEAAKWTKVAFIIGIVQAILSILWVMFWGGMAFLGIRHDM